MQLAVARRLSRLVLPLVLACVATALPAAPAAAKARPCANADLVPTATNSAEIRRATLCLLNRERTRRGRKRLRAHGALRRVAERYAHQMVTHNFFAHVGLDGSTLRSRVQSATGYITRVRRWSLGENLYWGSGSLATPRQSVRAWMHSPGHKRNVLNRSFRDIGIGVAIGAPQDGAGPDAATYATEFGRRTRR